MKFVKLYPFLGHPLHFSLIILLSLNHLYPSFVFQNADLIGLSYDFQLLYQLLKTENYQWFPKLSLPHMVQFYFCHYGPHALLCLTRLKLDMNLLNIYFHLTYFELTIFIKLYLSFLVQSIYIWLSLLGQHVKLFILFMYNSIL